ncbi:MAG: hypothetical protein A3E36_00345 [Candidatus Andersenbacteria bacterium RIFCSPHIGHO2_12_FULL_45_11b]|uniref:NodB homology domain-containing protein n=1 Tax=Candidatus Andersenbacteria bacterium RIFCSPHIGHO2_12_FULL_45_11b TaxID=1797282 RepID=A0A1G1XCM9_9BACT|nr:MAG: hypothetical protein A3E36_00345 [Candidatus Andersenbacteria bacterium RIFCSPHIGHO2_12_FULL_45_11b]
MRGILTLVFDDGYKDVYDAVIPLLKKYRIRAVFAVPLSPMNTRIENEVVESVDHWQKTAEQEGHELAAHGITHHNLTTLSHTQLIEELAVPVKQLSAQTLVYPGGAYNDNVLTEAKKLYRAARTVKFGLESIPPLKPFELKTINYTKKNFSLARANLYALVAYLQNKWCIETFHMIRNRHSAMKHAVSLDDLEAHLDFIASIPISTLPIRNVINEYEK